MKKTILTLALFALTVGSAFAQVSVGAGYLNNTSKTKVNDDKTDVTSNGFYVSGDYTVGIVDGLGVNFGLQGAYLTSTKNGSVTVSSLTGSSKTTAKEVYIALPIDVKYTCALTPDLKLFAFAGPTFSYGVSSKTDTDLTFTVSGISSTTSSSADNYNDDNASLKPFNIFVGGGIGADICDFIRVKGGYDYGLMNISKTDDTTTHQSRWYVGVAYIF